MKKFCVYAVSLVASVVLAACGGRSEEKTATQVAVKVNKNEISVHQVNAQLSRIASTGMTPEQQQLAKKQVVDNLVDQQLLVEQAIDKKLDRDPDVLAAIEASRRQILAQAYVQKAVGVAAKPTDEEIAKYYAANPQLFSERKAYRLQEVATNLPVEKLAQLNEQVAKSKSLTEVANWLKSNGYQVAGNSAVRGAEQLPLATLPQISQMKDGEMAAFANDRKVTVLQVVATQSQPLNEKEAAPFIEKYLVGQKREELAQAEMKRLRGAAKLEFIGEIASLEKTVAPATDASPMKATAPEKSAAQSTVDKGVSGLK